MVVCGQGPALCDSPSKFQYTLWDLCIERAFCNSEADRLTAFIQAALDADLAAFVQRRECRLLASSNEANLKPMMDALRPLYRPQLERASSMWRKDGSLTTSLLETKEVLADNFAEYLDAKRCTMSSLIETDRAANVLNYV